MRLVVDANVLFAVLIKRGITEDIFLLGRHKLFAPSFLFEEFNRHRDLLLNKTYRSGREFEILLNILKKNVKMVEREEYKNFIKEAEQICPDENDVEYFALALKLGCGIWSNDKRLKEQEGIKVYSTEDLAKEFDV